MRYPYLPLIALIVSIINNFAYSMIQVLIGRAFDIISQPEWLPTALLVVAVGVFVAALALPHRDAPNPQLAAVVDLHLAQHPEIRGVITSGGNLGSGADGLLDPWKNSL